MRTASLSRQLIGGVLLAELLCAALFSFIAIGHEMHGRRRAFDIMLRGRADSLLGAIQDAEDPEDNVFVDPTELAVPPQDAYIVFSPTGRTIGRSANSSSALLAALSAPRPAGNFNFRANGDWYRALRFDGIRVIDRNEEQGGLRRPVTILYASPTHDLWHEAVEAVQFYILAGVILLAVTAAILVWFLRRRLAPLQELAALAAGVSAHSWEFAPPASVLRTAELAPIALSIQQLVRGLQQAFERQRQLTGDAAHELKTSIAVLKSSIQLLTMSPRTAPQYEAGLEGLILDTERMEDLASRMLTLARLEEAPIDGSGSSDLQLAVSTVAQRLRPFAGLRQVTLDVNADATPRIAMQLEDAELLCSNLIMNALQHSPPAARVTAIVHTCDSSVELQVIDQGDGIPSASLPHVFQRFYRADRSRSRNSGGAGLGLSICKAIVERASGTIHIQSQPGTGTQVTVRLPPAPH